jgi:hypothetical protein
MRHWSPPTVKYLNNRQDRQPPLTQIAEKDWVAQVLGLVED